MSKCLVAWKRGNIKEVSSKDESALFAWRLIA